MATSVRLGTYPSLESQEGLKHEVCLSRKSHSVYPSRISRRVETLTKREGHMNRGTLPLESQEGLKRVDLVDNIWSPWVGKLESQEGLKRHLLPQATSQLSSLP